MLQSQAVNAAEVGLLLLVERTLGSRHGGRRHHVDEASRVPIYLAHPFVARLGRDEHHHVQAVAFGRGLVVLAVFAQGQVGDDEAVDAARPAVLAEGFEAELEDGVEVAHQQQGNVYRAADVGQLVEEAAQAHAAPQGGGGGLLDDGAVGQGVAEGDAYLNHVHARVLQGLDGGGGAVGGGAAGTEVDGENAAALGLEKLVYTVHGFLVYISCLSVYFNEFLQCLERLPAFQRTAGDVDALAYLLVRLHELDGEGGVHQHAVLLGRRGTVGEHVVEDAARVLAVPAPLQVGGAGGVEAQLLRAVDALVAAGHYLELVGQGDFVVVVEAVDHGKLDARLAEYIGVEAHQRQLAHAQQLVGRTAGVDEWAQQVEQGTHAQRLAHGGHRLHGGVEELGVEVGQVAFVHAAAQGVEIGSEADAVLLDDVARAAH